jgi:Ca-activated chloride channel family protein
LREGYNFGELSCEELPMPKVAKVAFLFAVIAGSPFARGQAAFPGANVPDVAASSEPVAPVAPAEWPQVILNVLVDLRKGATVPTTIAPLEIVEDGVPQKIESNAGPGTPVSLCLLIDVSGSMTTKQSEVRDAAAELVKNMPAGSEVMVSTFAEKSTLVLPFTPAAEVDFAVFGRPQQGQRTALNDAMVIAEPYFVHVARYPRRALVLITDGGDNASKHRTNDVIRSMEIPSGPFVYVLGVVDPYAPTPEERMSLVDLETFSSAGAIILKFSIAKDLSKGAAEISQCIDRQYALSYLSALTAPDKRLHKIEVRPSEPEPRIKIESLPGYYIQSD